MTGRAGERPEHNRRATDETQEAAFSVSALLFVQTTIPRKTVSYSFECVIQIKLAEARP